jgi:hypothetical protein
LAGGTGPSDKHIANAVQGFAEVFDYWYIRVMREAVAKYRTLLVQRINPFIRRIQYEGTDCSTFAARLVDDYNTRNFVTAGGWALEALALRVNPDFQKSASRGVDLQRFDQSADEYHLYVLKSGLVTRNSDIVSALKKNSRDAEKLLRQSGSKAKINLNYAIAAGKTTSTFEDGVHRPSSAEFWSAVMKLPEEQAVNLALAIAAEAGRLVRSDASQHATAMKVLLEAYLAEPNDSSRVDWEFLKQRNFQPKAVWTNEDKRRHKNAITALAATGYGETGAVEKQAEQDDKKPQEELENGDLADRTDALDDTR